MHVLNIISTEVFILEIEHYQLNILVFLFGISKSISSGVACWGNQSRTGIHDRIHILKFIACPGVSSLYLLLFENVTF